LKVIKQILINNYAFIDGQNLYKSIQRLGWNIDLKNFRVLLKDKFKVEKAYYFIGHLDKNNNFYDMLQRWNYSLIFKKVQHLKNGIIKGNVDAELVLQAMIDYNNYEKAVLVTGDGDYACLVKHLEKNNKLRMVIAPTLGDSSILLRRECNGKFAYLDELKDKLELKRKETEPHKD
jgi:uncharacterized LabA/DUF88 family protein